MKESIMDQICDTFMYRYQALGTYWKKFSNIKKWKEKNRKLFVLLLPVSLPFYLVTLAWIIVTLLALTVLFVGFWIGPCVIGIVFTVVVLSLPLLFWEIYTGKRSEILTHFYR